MMFCISSYSQKADSLVGKWKFVDIVDSKKLDKASKDFMKQMFGDMSLTLKKNKKYDAYLMKKEEGDWNFNEASQKITLTNSKGQKDDIILIKLTDKQMIIDLGDKKPMIFEKVSDGSTSFVIPPFKMAETSI